MKIQIRQQVFETNSSSMHSMVIVSRDDFEKFKAGELNLAPNRWENEMTADPANNNWSADPIWDYEYFIHLDDDNEGYDMSFDAEEYKDYPPGSVEDYGGDSVTLHYQF